MPVQPITDSAATEEVIATTVAGRLRGARQAGICSFKGVPYAASTAGSARFRAPQPVPPWSGVRDALTWGPRCPQERETYGDAPIFNWYAQSEPFSEDCCVLNVYTPALDDKRRPVMVYLHGGGYVSGGGGGAALDGSQLAAFGDVVVVTLNHRLNVFGFSNFSGVDAQAYPDAANAGLLDIIAALQWIQANIAGFGGDPGCVTLFGQSGGGSKIMVLMGMPAARGLFHRAINMSGTSGTKVVDSTATQPFMGHLLAQLQVDAQGLATLQQRPAGELLQARAAALKQTQEGNRPVVDGRHILGSPMDPACVDNHAAVPLMMGTTASEATFHFAADDRHLKLSRRQVLDRLTRQFQIDDAKAEEIMGLFSRDDPTRNPSQVLMALITETLYRGPMTRAAEAKVAAGGAPVYLYNFAWRCPVDDGLWGTPHATDIPFIFGTLDDARQITGDAASARIVSRALMTAAISFARTGNPNNSLMPAWTPYDAQRRPTMVIDEHCSLVDDYRPGDRDAGAKVQLEPFNRSALMTYRD